MNISVIIPTYKNKSMLLTNLRHNLPYLKDCEIIVVNDFPEESLVDDLKEFQSVKLVQNKTNLGFAGAMNQGIAAATQPYLFFLNNDVKLIDDSYKKALGYFEHNKNLFAVSFAQKERNEEIVGKSRMYWHKGMFLHSKAHDLKFGISAWAEGGSCIVDHQKVKELEGFDEVFKPFYWEDIDLSYRAWKAGYEIVFDPTIVVEHHHESTTGKYFKNEVVKTIAYRNQFLFMWKNISDTSLQFQHYLYLGKNLLYYTIKGEWPFLKGFFQALRRIPQLKTQKNTKKTDKEILQLFT